MNHPHRKDVVRRLAGRLWLTSREVDHDGTVVYALACVHHEFVDGFRHKYEAIAAAEDQP